MNPKTNKIILKSIGVLALLQLCRFLLKQFIFLFIPKTLTSDVAVSAAVMVVLTVLIVLIAKRKSLNASFFPQNRKSLYAMATIIAVALLISTPIITGDSCLETLLILAFSAIITPIFEELIFRGYVWNSLKKKYDSEFKVYIITTVLFAVWHLGYIDSIAFRTTAELLPFAMFMKVMTGLCFGIVLGLLRYKTKNSYSTILLHGVMNIFGR